MPLSPRERRAVWHARQHYFKEFLLLLGPEPTETETPAAFVATFRRAIELTYDRINAEDPEVYDALPVPPEFPILPEGPDDASPH